MHGRSRAAHCLRTWTQGLSAAVEVGRLCIPKPVPVISAQLLSNCSTYPLIRKKVFFSCGFPFTRMSPSTFPLILRPARTSRSVVLPAPLGPISAVIVPGRAIPGREINSWGGVRAQRGGY